MRFQLHLVAATCFVAFGLGALSTASAADREARDAVLGRQKIRAELTAALAKGYLTRMEQYHILLHAKEVLSPDDLHGLEQTLDRMAATQAATRPGAAAMASEAAAIHSDADRQGVTPSKYEETRPAEMPSADPAARRAVPLGDGPQMEEVPAMMGKPAMHMDPDDPEGCGCDADACHFRRRWFDVDFFESTDAFKGPIDIGNANGNFGVETGVNAAVEIFPRLGIGFQLGTSLVLSDLKGSPYPSPNSTIRDQLFTTVGMFQRINSEAGSFTWGFAYDWLFDDYYDNFNFGQWRVKGAWEFNPCNEIGILTTVPEHGASGTIPNFFGGTDLLHFKPIAQGYLYWKHTWENEASVTGRAGVAERPGEFVFGSSSRVPLTQCLALTSDVSYIMPLAAGGPIGQTQEFWNVSVGVEFVLGGLHHGSATCFQPFIPVANNGSMAVRELY